MENHELDMIENALDFYKDNFPTLNSLDRIHVQNLKEKVTESLGGKELNYRLMNDEGIKEICETNDMISPLVEQTEDGVISYGLGSFGYDIRVSNTFEIFNPVANTEIDPKDFDEDALHHVEDEDSIVIPPNSFALGHSIEKFNMPENVMGICLGKSTYARCGIIVNMTPIEPGWRGHLTIEISNTTPLPAKVYSNEGIAQALFFLGKRPAKTYDDKEGKYQDQTDGVHISEVVKDE